MNKTLQSFLTVAFLALGLPNNGMAQNNALHFDGDAVITGLSGVSPASFTIEFWMKSTYSGTDRYQGIYWQNLGNGRGIYMDNYEADYAHSQTLSIFPNASDYTAFQSWSESTPAGDIPSAQQNIWRHYAITCDGSNIKFYFDGVLIRNVAYSGALLPVTNVQIGGTYPLTGYSLDELRIWNFAKTQSQIQDQKDIEVLPNLTGLVRYYDFNQGVSGGNNAGVTTLIERVGGNTDGTLSNFELSGSTSNWVNGAPVNNVLSVKLAQFSVKSVGQGALLEWKTSSEKDNNKFLIYRGDSDNNFVKIGEVFGAGTSAIANNYSFNDKHPLKGNNYYKLIQVDGNGKATELDVKLLSTVLVSNVIKFYPNPVKNQLSFETQQIGQVLFVYNALGKLMLQNMISQERSVIDVNTLEPGMYMYYYGQQKGKFVKE